MTDEPRTERCVLRLFGADPAALAEAVGRFAPRWNANAQWRSRSGETLLALCAPTSSGLKKARQSLRTSFPAALYGEGDTTLAVSLIETLERCDRLLVCADAAAGALLDARLENVPGAERVFDFGALSYAHPKTGPQIEKRARAKLHLPPEGADLSGIDPVRLALARAQAARRVVGAELSAACAEKGEERTLVLAARKGCWLRTVPTADNPALWLMDMIRRAAADLPQAEGTRFLPGRKAAAVHPETAAQAARPTAQKPPRTRRRWVWRLLLLLGLAALAGAWYWTGGALDTLPDRLRELASSSLPHSGAKFL